MQRQHPQKDAAFAHMEKDKKKSMIGLTAAALTAGTATRTASAVGTANAFAALLFGPNDVPCRRTQNHCQN